MASPRPLLKLVSALVLLAMLLLLLLLLLLLDLVAQRQAVALWAPSRLTLRASPHMSPQPSKARGLLLAL